MTDYGSAGTVPEQLLGRHLARFEALPDGRLVKYRRINGGWQRWLTYTPGAGWLRHVVCYRSPHPNSCIQYSRPLLRSAAR